MQILICAATEAEIKPSINFFKTLSLPYSIQFLITGVGLTPTTYQLTKYLATNKPAAMIQAGIGGGFTDKYELCQTLAIKSEALGDVGVMEGDEFKNIFNLNLVSENEAPWHGGKLFNPYIELQKQSDLPRVDAVSVNEVTTNAARIQYYQNTLGVAVESMEGAAFHYVCLMENIPFLQLRTLSNFIGERNKAKWKLKDSIHCLNKELQRIIINFDV